MQCCMRPRLLLVKGSRGLDVRREQLEVRAAARLDGLVQVRLQLLNPEASTSSQLELVVVSVREVGEEVRNAALIQVQAHFLLEVAEIVGRDGLGRLADCCGELFDLPVERGFEAGVVLRAERIDSGFQDGLTTVFRVLARLRDADHEGGFGHAARPLLAGEHSRIVVMRRSVRHVLG